MRVFARNTRRMDYRTQLITLAGTFATARGISEARVATLVANDGQFFSKLRRGRKITVDTYLAVQAWFAANWPAGLDWPAGVDPVGVLPKAAVAENLSHADSLPPVAAA